MAICVVGCGRSGTNLTLEILSGNSFFICSKNPEDKKFFARNKEYTSNYLTKCDTIYISRQKFDQTLSNNKDLKIIWPIRDPRDMILSKIYRGQPKSQGGDCDVLAEDATEKGCLNDLFHMFDLYKYISSVLDSNSFFCVKMEELVLYPENSISSLCNSLSVKFCDEMLYPWNRMRNNFKKQRYSKGFERKEIAKWKNLDNLYNSFFVQGKGKNYDITKMFEAVTPLIEEFNYEI